MQMFYDAEAGTAGIQASEYGVWVTQNPALLHYVLIHLGCHIIQLTNSIHICWNFHTKSSCTKIPKKYG